MDWFQGNFGLLNKLKERNESYYLYMMVSSVDSILPDGKAGYRVESVQDFLIKLDMKPYSGNKHSFNKSCHRQSYQNYEQSWQKLDTTLKQSTYLKNQNFQKTFLLKVGLLVKYPSEKFFLERFDQFLTKKNDFESTNFEMFEEDVHNFGKSDDDMI